MNLGIRRLCRLDGNAFRVQHVVVDEVGLSTIRHGLIGNDVFKAVFDHVRDRFGNGDSVGVVCQVNHGLLFGRKLYRCRLRVSQTGDVAGHSVALDLGRLDNKCFRQFACFLGGQSFSETERRSCFGIERFANSAAIGQNGFWAAFFKLAV